MMLAAILTFALIFRSLAAPSARLPIVIPLVAACLVLVGLIPLSAARGKLHVAGYAGIALLAFAVSFIFGKLAGLSRIAASPAGPIFSIIFFLLIAVAVGSILALVFYRDPPVT